MAYPLSRTIPLFTLLLAVFILKEQVSAVALIGILLIVFGGYSVHLKDFSFKGFITPVMSIGSKGSIFALLTALVSAFYALVSKISLGVLHPVVLVYLGFLFALIFYSAIFLFYKRVLEKMKIEFRRFKKEIITIGVLDIFGYFLVLLALRGNKLSYIVALRQMSIIFAVVLGARLLKEKYARTRVISSLAIFAGIILIAIPA